MGADAKMITPTKLFSLTCVALLAGVTMFAEVRAQTMNPALQSYTLDYTTATDANLQAQIEAIDGRLRAKFQMTAEQSAVGVLDLQTLRLALVRPDKIDYAASVPKIAILLAWFATHPEAATKLDADTRRELGLMIKVSDNAMASKYSQQLGLKRIQEVLDSYGFYDAKHGGGIWMGKHYAKAGERVVDPVGGHSHGATVRQLLRFYLLLEQGKLVSTDASKTIREIFVSPEIAHRNDKFVKGLAGRDVQILRKAGWWETWFHDTAVVSGPGRRYIVVAMTHHARGDDYLAEFAAAVDDVMAERER
jgi:beta-lactamase class A